MRAQSEISQDAWPHLMRVLIVDDSISALASMKNAIAEGLDVDIETCADPVVACGKCADQAYDLVLVDYTMPKLNGIELITRLRRQEGYQTVPIVMVTSESDRSTRLDAIRMGATDFLNKPFDPLELQARARNLLRLRQVQLELARHNDVLEDAVARATEEIAAREEEIIWRLARAIETRDGGTGAHVSRVALIACLLADGLGLNPKHCRMIYLATPLHDLGKIGIPDELLGKPGKLTDEEMARMREHVTVGVQMLENGSSELVRIAAMIAGGHHERWDGKGYPNGLAGEDIPIEARIVAVADVFDALCSDRPYKRAWPLTKAYDEIVANAGTQFDPSCVAVFRQRWLEIVDVMRHADMSPVLPGLEGIVIPAAGRAPDLQPESGRAH